jgi:hypothetical protein
MKSIRLIILLAVIATSLHAQNGLPPNLRLNKLAAVSERVGVTDVRMTYSRPAVSGREGKIWGEVVHYGFEDLHYGTSKAAPWRAGADENTTFEVTTDVQIEGKALPAGKYGFFIAMGKDKATLVFSKDYTAWGSFYYKPEHDALRLDVPVVQTTQSTERLKYEFSDQTDNSAVVTMYWEKIKIPFKVSVDLVKEQIAAYRREVDAGAFYAYWQKLNTAANYCLINDTNLEEALSWSERSIFQYFGEKNFLTLSTYSGLLEKLDKKAKADSVMKVALPMATMLQMHQYGYSLLRRKKYKEAYDIFKANSTKYPKELYPMLGMIIGNAGVGNTKEAIAAGNKALEFSEDANTKAYIEKLLTDLKGGKSILP